jgi:HPt (histidine-containing phosphotransfer) domain-containing protein
VEPSEPNLLFNESELRERLGGDDRFLLEVVGIFVSECPGWLTGLERAVRLQDTPNIKRFAHLLHGGALSLAAEILAEDARDLEVTAFAGSPSQIQPMADRVRHSLHSLLVHFSTRFGIANPLTDQSRKDAPNAG